jgi:hypothetical protein
VSAALVLLALAPLFSQSLAEAARANRPKDAKITARRVWNDDDVKLGDYGQQVSMPPASAARKTATSNLDIKVKSPDQLGFDCFGNRQWPEANIWQEHLWIAYWGLLDAAQDYNSNHTAAALTDMVKAQTAFTDTHERCRVAVYAWDANDADAEHLSVPGGLMPVEQHHSPPLNDLRPQHSNNR